MKSIRRNSRLVVDQLESRFLLAAVFWDGGGDGVLWRTAANWSNNTLPTADDDVTIDVAGNPSIVYDGLQVFPYNVTIRSLVCNESFSIRSPLTVTNGVAINSAVTTRGEEFRIDNGLTLNGSITSETYSGDIGVRLILGGDQAFIAGTGTITSTDENDRLIITNATSVNNVSQTMTIGANISMATRRFAQIGSNAGGTVVNNGHLSVVGPEQLNDVGRLGGVNQQFINNGTMSFVDTITSLYNVVNSPTGSITAQEGQLNFNADEGNEGPFSWDNNGSISTTETLVSFLDTFEFEDIGNFTVTGGMARVGGTMQNIGRIATLTESIPELYLVGSINGGTVNAIGSASIVSSSAWINGVTRSGMLYGVTLNAPLRVSSGHEIQIRNGLTLNSTLGAANQDIDASVEFSGASHQTLNGTGSILSLGTGECGVINSQRNLTTGQGFDLTIGSEIKINLAKNSYVHTSYGKTTNYGVITFQGTGGPTFTGSARMSTSREFRNYGTIRAFNSVSVNLDHLVNEVGGVIEANASRMIFREQSASISWNNDGVLNNVGGEFQFTGNFTWDDIGAFTRSGNSVMRIVGTLDNTGQTREFNDQTGDWIITGGTILNGTVTTTSGHQLIPQGATFIDVTINTDLTVTDATSIFIHNSLTLNGTIKFVSPSSNGNRLYFRGTGMTVMGVGQIRFETLASAGLYNECIVNSVPQPLVFGAGIDLRLDASTSIIAGTGATTRLDGHMLMVGNTVSDIRIGSTGSKFINNGSI
ncbi:MAG TPA: hypothetical protein PK402_01095, partial [Tepidisphaeraceae bacterium]|nr:hypothetical protein [Tepidisphaeraceae bacterium]